MSANRAHRAEARFSKYYYKQHRTIALNARKVIAVYSLVTRDYLKSDSFLISR